MTARRKLTAWGRGALKALDSGVIGFGHFMISISICILIIMGMIAFTYLITGALSLVTGQPPENLSEIAVEVGINLVLLVFLVIWFYERISGGRVLFDCGLHFTWYKFLYLILAVFLTFFMVKELFTKTRVWNVTLDMWCAVVLIISATGRGQVKEKGIWSGWRLLQWDKIRSYRWKDDSTLLFQEKGFLSLFKETLHVPPEHKQAVDDILRTHVSVQPSAMNL